jgi:hypothetical protein
MSGHSEGGAAGELKWLIIVLAVLWFLWFLGGGANNPDSNKPFINPPAPISNGQVYGPGDSQNSAPTDPWGNSYGN